MPGEEPVVETWRVHPMRRSLDLAWTGLGAVLTIQQVATHSTRWYLILLLVPFAYVALLSVRTRCVLAAGELRLRGALRTTVIPLQTITAVGTARPGGPWVSIAPPGQPTWVGRRRLWAIQVSGQPVEPAVRLVAGRAEAAGARLTVQPSD